MLSGMLRSCSRLIVYFFIFHDVIYQAWAGTSRIVATEGVDATLICRYSPSSSPNTFRQLVWLRKSSTTLLMDIYCNTPPKCFPPTPSPKYELQVDFETTGNLTIKDVELDDEGTYVCDVTDLLAIVGREEVELVVQVPPNNITVDKDRGNHSMLIDGILTVRENEPFDIFCIAEASKPCSSIAWYPGEISQISSVHTPSTFPNSRDNRYCDTKSRWQFNGVSRAWHQQILTCRAEIADGIYKETKINLHVESQPDYPVEMSMALNPSKTYSAKCIARNSYPASRITWFVSDRNITNDATSTYNETASGHFDITSELRFRPQVQDNGTPLECRVHHVTLGSPIIQKTLIHVCKSDVSVDLNVENKGQTYLTVNYRVFSTATSCGLRTCERTADNKRGSDSCKMINITAYKTDATIEITGLKTSTGYELVLACQYSCGQIETKLETGTQGSAEELSINENSWIRELIFVIIAVIIVTAFVIVVTVTIVLKAVLKVKIQEDHEHSADRRASVICSYFRRPISNNLYTIRELDESEGENTIYQEIKEFATTDPVCEAPSDIDSCSESSRLTTPSPPPPPPPPPLPPLAHLSIPSGFQDNYVPMSPKSDEPEMEYETMRQLTNS